MVARSCTPYSSEYSSIAKPSEFAGSGWSGLKHRRWSARSSFQLVACCRGRSRCVDPGRPQCTWLIGLTCCTRSVNLRPHFEPYPPTTPVVAKTESSNRQRRGDFRPLCGSGNFFGLCARHFPPSCYRTFRHFVFARERLAVRTWNPTVRRR